MSIPKTLDKYTAEDIADAMIVPAKLSVLQKKEAKKQLTAHRNKRRAEMTEQEKLHFEVLKLKLQLEDYVMSDNYDPEFTFGYFLEQYLKLTNRKKKEFADDIQIHETLLSNILRNRREPNESFMIRLELHSRNMIPAIDWFKLLEKEKCYKINTNRSLRDQERRFVTNNLALI